MSDDGAINSDDDAERSPKRPRPALKTKPRDERLRNCFNIIPTEDGGESVSCKYCPDYNKVIKKFNPTKGREHLTEHCPGVEEKLRQILLSTTQAAKRLKNEPLAAGKGRKSKGAGGDWGSHPVFISFHTDDTSVVSRGIDFTDMAPVCTGLTISNINPYLCYAIRYTKRTSTPIQSTGN